MSTQTTAHDMVLDEIPNHLLTTDDIYHLSSVIHSNIGLAAPLVILSDHDQYENSVMAFTLESDGITRGYYFDGDEWNYTSTSERNFNQDESTASDNIRETVQERVKEIVPPWAVELYSMEQSETPPGFDAKYHAPNQPQSPEKRFEGHKIEESSPLHINNNHNVISYTIIECDEGDHSLVHVYYQPEIGSWRVIDAVSFESGDELANLESHMLNNSTEPRIDKHYDEYTRFDHQGGSDKITIN